MKKCKITSRGLLSRVILAILLLGILGGVLTSCGGGGSTKITTLVKSGEIEITEENKEAHGLDEEKLNNLATKIAEHKQGFVIREQFIAALNGYDMTAEDFDDSKVALPGETLEGAITPQPEKAPEFAINALKKAEIETFPYKEDDRIIMTTADVEAIVKCFETTVDVEAKLGVLDQVLYWIGIAFGWLIEVPGFGSFILGTVYFAILIELLMLPLGIRQQKNSQKQARLRPKEMAIRNKYKGRNDQATMQKLNQEIQSLYQKEGFSPTAGCLPLLITLPFLMFLYYIVIDPLVYMMGASEALSSAFLTYAGTSRAAGGLGLTLGSTRGTIEVLSLIRENGLSLDSLADFAYFSNGDACLSALDGMVDRIPSFSLFGVNMGLTPTLFEKPYILMLMPVLTFVVYWGSGKITRKFSFQPMQNGQNDPAQGCSNGMMNIMMPAMSAFFTFMVPAAVGLYWMFKSVIGTVKQIILYKVMPLPVFSEEEYKAAERELSGKDKNKPIKKSGSGNPNVRSLHHIDDEDYDVSAPVIDHKKAAAKPDYVEPEEEKTPRTAEGAYGDGVTLKEDRPGRPEKKEKKKKTAEESSADTAATSDEIPANEGTDKSDEE